MGFEAKKTIMGGEVIPTHTLNNSFDLNKQEIELLINLIKDSKFLGKDVEILYNLVIKLQNQHQKQ